MLVVNDMWDNLVYFHMSSTMVKNDTLYSTVQRVDSAQDKNFGSTYRHLFSFESLVLLIDTRCHHSIICELFYRISIGILIVQGQISVSI
jgi:capsule polysaccharide modification protein KpsS